MPAALCPDLTATAELTRRASLAPLHLLSIVIVHGTGSCAIPIAAALMKAGVTKPVYRFEHDTFASIASNAKDLATLAQAVPSPGLLLACHSRGGLVGRQAAQLLCQTPSRHVIKVVTFGTPHEGTPIANLPPKAIGMTYLLGFTNHGGHPYADPVTAAFYYLTKARQTPEGIAEMRPGCGFLALLNQAVDPFPVESWGGCYDCGGGPTGFGPAMKGTYGRQAFAGADNDLVVATSSATSRGSPQTLPHCSHFDYFSQKAVLNRLITT
jgi:pimeloyl-ACP methyl ester carboxylesterase